MGQRARKRRIKKGELTVDEQIVTDQKANEAFDDDLTKPATEQMKGAKDFQSSWGLGILQGLARRPEQGIFQGTFDAKEWAKRRRRKLTGRKTKQVQRRRAA